LLQNYRFCQPTFRPKFDQFCAPRRLSASESATLRRLIEAGAPAKSNSYLPAIGARCASPAPMMAKNRT
jgi:hypothetical protein